MNDIRTKTESEYLRSGLKPALYTIMFRLTIVYIMLLNVIKTVSTHN